MEFSKIGMENQFSSQELYQSFMQIWTISQLIYF